jgi:CHAT domain-containing protein
VTYQPITDRSGKQLEVYCLAPNYPLKESKEKEVTRGSFYHLPFAKMEVDSIQNLFGDLAMTSQSSDKEEWEKNISASTIFHYAGHAIIQGDQSYLALDSQEDEKKQLTSSEIGLMHHPLDLVVLSACETGLGKIEQGEGIRSLGRNFMEAGAQATIISLWNVNDKSTALIMTDFYKQLKAGKPKDEALRQAKLNYLQRATQKNSHPYFWAAFIPAGDMSVLEK